MLESAHDYSDTKSLGAYYTPATIAGILAEWVVRTGNERLLEPSVGEGALVEAAVARALAIEGVNSHLHFLACDIDPSAIARATNKLPIGSEVKAIDFLELDVRCTEPFHGVIANPPFTRNHSIPLERRAALRKRFHVSGAAGLWVHFLHHAIEFLMPGGRLAAVIPASALFADYGRSALERIAFRFQTVELYQIADKPLWVNGADERGAILLAAGFKRGSSALPTVSLWSEREGVPPRYESTCSAFDTLSLESKPLGALASLRIGAVTGCNSIFLMNEEDRDAAGIALRDVKSVASRARHVSGLQISSEELAALGAIGERTWLLRPDALGHRGSSVRNRLAMISSARRRNTKWFAKRDPWWQVQISDGCDALFTYMNDSGPRLVLTGPNVCATNTLHEVRFNRDLSQSQKLATSLSMISVFGQIAAERGGRSYGGGLLKFELGDARKLPVLPAPKEALEAAFTKAHLALLEGDRLSAQAIADEVLIAPILGLNWRGAVSSMMDELTYRRDLRRGRRD